MISGLHDPGSGLRRELLLKCDPNFKRGRETNEGRNQGFRDGGYQHTQQKLICFKPSVIGWIGDKITRSGGRRNVFGRGSGCIVNMVKNLIAIDIWSNGGLLR